MLYCISHHSANFSKSRDKRILEFLEGKEEVAGTFFDHVGAMFNGPKIKKERDQLLASNKVKDIMYENALESNKAELEKSKTKATYDKEILEERLRSERREKASLADAHNSQIQSIHTEKALRNAIELEYTKLSLYVNGQKYELTGSVGVQHLSKADHVRSRYL